MQTGVDSCFFGRLCQSGFRELVDVRSSDGECVVVDIEPTGKDVTKVGEDVYQTREQAEADARICI